MNPRHRFIFRNTLPCHQGTPYFSISTTQRTVIDMTRQNALTPNGHVRARHAKPATTRSTSTSAEVGEVHANRYPKHEDPTKGQVYNGVCNTTACVGRRAVWLNRGTFGLYCTTCARGQNRYNEVPICILVDRKPTIAEMDAHHHAMMADMSALRKARHEQTTEPHFSNS
ncbi:hypothetical protein LCGC14_2575330 [marine sediment metagenome]|uniref:Uncharacterized protein n=1 Tax=marine sediment metagenome TaxID=412755 RepID=A0A0F9AGF1_9ZZZZ